MASRKRISCPRVSPHVVRVTATALIVNEGRVLLGKRTSKIRFAEMWDAFGGHIESGETADGALRRELWEELGIRVTAAKFLEIYDDLDPTSREPFRHHLFLVTAWEGEPRIANEEHSDIRWFRPDEAVSLDLMPHLKRAIQARVTAKP